MGQIAYRANLSSATYPMTLSDGGRTVIMPGPDQNFDRRVDPQGEQKDAGIPQALYLENVMPTVNGYQSAGLWTPKEPMTTGGAMIGSVFEAKTLVSGIVESISLFQRNDGVIVTGDRGTDVILIAGTLPSYPAIFSAAVVRGICYLYDAASRRLYTLVNKAPLELTEVTASVTPLNFFTTNSILCIVGSSNYLVAISATTVYYSSTTTPLDFVSSLVSGAGETTPNDLNGRALWAKESQSGFYIYSNNNTVYAQYTGNARYPWKFTAVRNSNGITDSSLVYLKGTQIFGESDSEGHYVIEKGKQLKFIRGIEAIAVAPEATEFLSKITVQEIFDGAANTFSAASLTTQTSQIYLYLNRYVIVSINGTALLGFSGAIVYDTVLQRYGKLKLAYTHIFTSGAIDFSDSPTLCFFNRFTATITAISFDIYLTSTTSYNLVEPNSVLVLGKFQYVRSRKIQLHEIEIEGAQNSAIIPAPNFSCVLLPSLDGRTFDAPVTPYQSTFTGGLASYNCHTTAQNISLAIKGAFSVNTVQLKFSPRGDR